MNFTKLLTTISLSIFCLEMSAQVGIGTVTPDAQLDVPASNAATPANTDGILIPRINAFPVTNPTVAQQGMLVFLTTASGVNSPGFYYWNDTTATWIGLTSTTTGWRTNGNAATVATTNFLGTTDDVNLVFRRNNVRAGLLGNPTPTSDQNTSFGANSLSATSSGARNTAVGTNVLRVNTSGSINTAVGESTLYSNTTGQDNSAFGVGALYSNTTGSFNTGLGRNALTTNSTGQYNVALGNAAIRSNTTGNNNTGAGFNSLRQNATGNNNTVIGYESFRQNTAGNANVGIGYQAGYFETASNKLYIENSDADANNALIYGEFDNNIVRLNGQLQINNQSTTGYHFPTARGTNKQILETDAVGNVTWVNPNNSMSVARFTMTGNQTLSGTGWEKLNFNYVLFDSNTEFNTGTNSFVPAKTGFYQVNAALHTNGQANTQYYSIGIYVDNVLYQETTANHFGNGPVARTINALVSLNAGQVVDIRVQNYINGAVVESFPAKTFFEVHQVK